MKTIEQVFKEHVDLCNEIFPKSTEISCLHHAIEEITEIWKDKDFTNKCEEYADVFMCLLHGMSKSGISLENMLYAFRTKIIVNRHREWIENADGSYSHKK